MNYPLISEYIQSIKFSSENFDKLNNLRPVLDADGNPIMSSGNFAVVFKMEDIQSGKLYAVKCFLREQEGRDESYRLIASELEYVSSTYLTPIQYLEKELFVDTTQGNDTEFPVLLMDWVEGLTLDKYVRNNIHDPYKLALITYQFCRMGSWLLSQEFAHGDLKPDNIIVREDGHLVLVDYDGMFVPAMRGQKSRELGSVDYRHPLRSENVFNGSIDDFSVTSIALSLKAISLKPELLSEFGAEDRLLFSAKDYQNISDSECLKAIQLLANDTELSQLLGLFYIAYGKNELNNISYRIFNISKPEFFMTPILEFEIRLSTEVTKEDLANAVEDDFGVLYSKDGKRLLKCKDGLKTYSIRNNTNVICDRAFYFCKSLQQIEIPDSVKYIGDSAFLCCSNLQKIIISRTVEIIGKSAFANCFSLTICSYNDRFIIYDNIFLIDKREKKLIACLTDLQQITIPRVVTSIGDGAFNCCSSLQQIIIPDSVTSIGDGAFNCCSSLQQIIIPDSVTTIGRAAFCNCISLQEIEIPNSVTTIGFIAFRFCHSLQQVTIPNSVTTIGNGAFSSCKTLKQIVLPDSLITIGKGMLVGSKSLQSIIVPKYKTDRYKNLLKYSNCDLSIIKEQDD
jgi:serine/threonine protein kinase